MKNQETEVNRSAEVKEEESPPIFGTWKRLYFLVILNLAVLIALFFIFSRLFE